MNKKLKIDSEGYLLSGDIRLGDSEFGHSVLSNIRYLDEPRVFECNWNGETIQIEPFDYPLVALSVSLSDKTGTAHFPYDFQSPFSLDSIFVDEYDRFVSFTTDGVPFLFSRAAQAEFFNRVPEFDDEGYNWNGRSFKIESFHEISDPRENHTFWSEIYQKEETPPWDLDGPHPSLDLLLSKMKLNKSRVLVLGCGRGHDAASFAKRGHFVTAVDYSPTAIAQAQELYSEIAGLEFVVGDAFAIPEKWKSAFDVVFEHTLFCAIHPQDRTRLSKSWNTCLEPGGYLMGFFWIFQRRKGPPFGSTEWEIKHHLEKKFRPLVWSRDITSPTNRLNSELMVVAEKK
ncbi:MAG: methyltransferase domain-containing protein [Bdellovibrionales bacterium]|nr:methyltransferase domain-containing protein [Bdellovibrionales bacterium]